MKKADLRFCIGYHMHHIIEYDSISKFYICYPVSDDDIYRYIPGQYVDDVCPDDVFYCRDFSEIVWYAETEDKKLC